jgi:glutamate-1-semialdehyde 2,1-aminomutase
VVTGELLTPALLDALFDRGERLRQRLAAVIEASPLPMSITGIGSLMNLHTVPGPVRSPADLSSGDPVLKELVFHELIERGIYLAARGYVAMSAAISDADCDQFVDALADALAAIVTAIR